MGAASTRLAALGLAGSFLFLGALASACGEPTEERSPTVVDTLRVLGVQAEPPELAPLERAALEVLAYDPAEAPLGYLWLTCDPLLDPDPEAPAYTPCQSAAAVSDPSEVGGLFSAGAARPLSLDLASPQAQWRPPLDEQGAPVDLFAPLAPADPRRQRGVAVTVMVLVAPLEALQALIADPSGADLSQVEAVVAVKRLVLSESTAPNQNPQLAGLSVGGVSAEPTLPLPLIAGAQVELVATLSPGSAEQYLHTEPDGGESLREERPVLSWFTTTGRLGSQRTKAGDPNLFEAPPLGTPPPRLWVVARDGRGGTQWLFFESELN